MRWGGEGRGREREESGMRHTREGRGGVGARDGGHREGVREIIVTKCNRNNKLQEQVAHGTQQRKALVRGAEGSFQPLSDATSFSVRSSIGTLKESLGGQPLSSKRPAVHRHLVVQCCGVPVCHRLHDTYASWECQGPTYARTHAHTCRDTVTSRAPQTFSTRIAPISRHMGATSSCVPPARTPLLVHKSIT